jgi:hypothetical protein
MTNLTHPERVAAAVPDDCKIVALLHDAVEDGHLPPLQAQHCLKYTEGEALDMVTRRPEWTYSQYIERMVRFLDDPDPRFVWPARVAVTVKIADLRDNLYGRPEGPPQPALRRRYEKALAVLEAASSTGPATLDGCRPSPKAESSPPSKTTSAGAAAKP